MAIPMPTRLKAAHLKTSTFPIAPSSRCSALFELSSIILNKNGEFSRSALQSLKHKHESNPKLRASQIMNCVAA